jgi:hypothetical protein
VWIRSIGVDPLGIDRQRGGDSENKSFPHDQVSTYSSIAPKKARAFLVDATKLVCGKTNEVH